LFVLKSLKIFKNKNMNNFPDTAYSASIAAILHSEFLFLNRREPHGFEILYRNQLLEFAARAVKPFHEFAFYHNQILSAARAGFASGIVFCSHKITFNRNAPARYQVVRKEVI